jgi:D-3-phosphoglycerate dehydrogenase / 2-oxoglutarate reductase
MACANRLSSAAHSGRGGPNGSGSRLNILVIGDAYFSSHVFARSLERLESRHSISYLDIQSGHQPAPATESEHRLRVLVVHGAPVTAEVLDAAGSLALVCCARGGPVNVDLEAAADRGIPVVTTPGKNAESVADLALAFMVMLARRLPEAMRRAGDGDLGASAFEGAEFFGNDLGGHVLGLVGFGQVGARVSVRARAFGMRLLAHDPFIPAAELEASGVEPYELDDLLRDADFVSAHARATPDNARMFDAGRFAAMKSSAYFVNTARPSLVDEAALEAALGSGGIAGAALDVLHPPPDGGDHPLARMDNVILTPHIGGATHETLARGADMIAEEIERFSEGHQLRYAIESRKD